MLDRGWLVGWLYLEDELRLSIRVISLYPYICFAVLHSWDFLRSVFKSGHASEMVKALGQADRSSMSDYSRESYTWLRRFLTTFAANPENMEAVTYAEAPITSPKYQEAVERKGFMPTKLQLGGAQGWPNDIAVVKVGLWLKKLLTRTSISSTWG